MGVPWSQYLAEMSNSGVYGDVLVLTAAANFLDAEIVVISTHGDGMPVISPETLAVF